MFDFVEFRPTLPDNWKPSKKQDKGLFQTKSFPEPSMSTFVVDKKGKLYMEIFEYKEVHMEKRPYYGTKQWNKNNGKNIYRHLGSLKKINRKVVLFDFTGHVFFYADVRVGKALCNVKWHEYQACFKNGKLQEVKVVINYWPNLFKISNFEEDTPYKCGI
jgi:hypothetical protein